MHVSNPLGYAVGGVILAVWILVNQVTGQVGYGSLPIERKTNPGLFWFFQIARGAGAVAMCILGFGNMLGWFEPA